MILLLTVGLVWFWFAYAESFALFLYRHAPTEHADMLYQNGPALFAGLLLLSLMILAAVSGTFEAQQHGDGLRNSSPVRRVIGLVAGATLCAALMLGIALILHQRMEWGPGSACLTLIFTKELFRPSKIILGKATRPLRHFLAARHLGKGGTASFSGLLDEWANPWRPGQILLGASRYDPKWLVGIEDDRHIATLATTRAGKGRSVIIPNLLTWPGSALIIDPKGQNAYVTARTRGNGGNGIVECLRQSVHILDPIGVIGDPQLQSNIARFNPLAELDLRANDYAERVGVIADALVVPSANAKDAFFDNSARALISGLIDYVLLSHNVGNDERTLATVRGLLIHPDGPPLDEMAELGGLSQAGAANVQQAGKNASGDIVSTAIMHTKWLDSVAMQKALSASDFSLRDLNRGNTTIYLVLPPQYLEEHARFLRLFVNLSLQAAAEGRKGKFPTLFLLDEFYALGRLQSLAKSAGLMAGYGVKLWPIIQNIGQLRELYPENWETFLGNAGQWMVFAMNDQTTAKYLSERLGKRINWRRMRGPEGYEWEVAGAANLRDAHELSKATSRASGNLTVFTESGDAFLLKRVPYDKLFKRNRYSPDPFEARKRTIASVVADIVQLLARARKTQGRQP